MTLSVKTATGEIHARVNSNFEAVRFLLELAGLGIKCLSWQIGEEQE